MNKDILNQMKKAQEAQANEIRQLDSYEQVSHEFNLEYTLAKELQEARKTANLTQKDIARIMGTTQSVISRIEHGCNVSVSTIEKYAHACGKHVELHLI